MGRRGRERSKALSYTIDDPVGQYTTPARGPPWWDGINFFVLV